MTIERRVSLRRLKPEGIQEYIRLHAQVWPELLEAYRNAGIIQVRCFLNGLDLVVYSVVDRDIYEKEKEALSRNPVEVRWQALMKTLDDPHFEEKPFDEVFSMATGKE